MDKIYHLSEENLDGKTLHPRVPNNFLVKNRFEEGKTPRISFSKSVGGSLTGISNNLSGKVFYIHIPEGDVDYYEPTVDEVPDVKCTHEVWVKQPVKLKLHKIIKVTSAQDKPLHYKYGNKIADTYKWNYDYVTESVVNDIHAPLRVSSKSTTNPNDPVSSKAVHLDFYSKNDHIGQVFISSVDTNNGFIYNLVVFKKYREQGYGREIMKYVLSHYDVRELTVTEDNTVAIALYKSMGFKLKKAFNDPQTHKKMLWMRCPRSNNTSESTEPSMKEIESFREDASVYIKERGRCDMDIFESIFFEKTMAVRNAEREAKFQKLLDKLGIEKFLKTQRIGFSEKDQKWYGFGLAYKGYGVGDKCKKDEFGIGDKFTFKEGDVLKTLDDCKQRAIDHVKGCTP